MSGSIYLNPKKGVNPYLTYCYHCIKLRGKDIHAVKQEDRPNDGKELMLVGIYGFVDTCRSCGMQHFGGAKKKEHSQPYSGSKECVKCGNDTFDRRKLGEYEKIPSFEPCEDCQTIIDEQRAKEKSILEGGGIFFECEDCGTRAMIRGDHPLSQEVREKLRIEAPLPCGVKFTSKECPCCRKEH